MLTFLPSFLLSFFLPPTVPPVPCIPTRAQPQVYRAIIDDVIANVSVDFEEYGMDDDLLPLLQSVSPAADWR